MKSLTESYAEIEEAARRVDATMCAQPFWYRLFMAHFMFWPFLIAYWGSPERWPVWYQRTAVEYGDAVLRIVRKGRT
jgi:hypothetical protein